MEETKRALFDEAIKQYGKIAPCGPHKEFNDEHFTTMRGRVQFWFNDEENATHIVEAEPS